MTKLLSRLALATVLAFAVSGVAWAQSAVQVLTSGGTSYLANAQGMALYYFTKDTNGTSTCTGGCAQAWPPFYAANIAPPSGLVASNFGTITRPDGSKQTTYMGWPLYTFSGDSSSGDMNGQGSGGVWVAATVPLQQNQGAPASSSSGSAGSAPKKSWG